MRQHQGRRISAALVLLGFILMALAAWQDAVWLSGEPYSSLIIVEEAADGVEGALPVLIHVLPSAMGEEEIQLTEVALGAVAESDDATADLVNALLHGPDMVLAPLDGPTFASLTTEGRAPQPGAREALAGDLIETEEFELDGETWTVTGRLPRGAGGLLYSYLVPETPELRAQFTDVPEEDAQAAEAFLYLDGTEAVEHWVAAYEAGTLDELEDGMPEVGGLVRGIARAPGHIAWMAYFALLLIALGGVPLYLQLGHHLIRNAPPMPGMLLTEIQRWPRVFIGMHILLFGVFFVAMAQGILHPLWNLRALTAVASVFSDGELQYVQDAYASGNILAAAWATFQNNYVLQTFGMTFFFPLTLWATGAGMSLPAALWLTPLPLGVAKTAASFGIVGFAMSPIWSGTALGYSYHSVTMVLELEAYVIACFVVVIWPVRMLYGALSRDARIMIGAGNLLAGGILVTAAMLAVAALYEAATLILLAG